MRNFGDTGAHSLHTSMQLPPTIQYREALHHFRQHCTT